MKTTAIVTAIFVLGFIAASSAPAQDPSESPGEEGAKGHTEQVVEGSREKIERIAEAVDSSEDAQHASAGVLRPIYELAEYLSFPASHWIAFAIMVTGVVSFALQLVLAKLVILIKMGFSLTSILSDALGLVISVVGLVLTTQAATENSTFTQSPAAVLSATVVGVVFGFVFYWWGQSQEIDAVHGRKA